jgi:hypothetical protein
MKSAMKWTRWPPYLAQKWPGSAREDKELWQRWNSTRGVECLGSDSVAVGCCGGAPSVGCSQGRIGVVETDEFARKRQQLEQLKTDLENKLGASRVQWTTAIREGHSSNQERTAFINNYKAQCSRLRELFGEKWELERELRSIQQS